MKDWHLQLSPESFRICFDDTFIHLITVIFSFIALGYLRLMLSLYSELSRYHSE